MKIFNKRKGVGFVEVILAMIAMSMMTMVVFQNSKLLLVSDKNNRMSEAGMMAKSYMNKAKVNCEDNGNLGVEETVVLNGSDVYDLNYSCTKIHNELYKVNLDVLNVNTGRVRNNESYFYKK